MAQTSSVPVPSIPAEDLPSGVPSPLLHHFPQQPARMTCCGGQTAQMALIFHPPCIHALCQVTQWFLSLWRRSQFLHLLDLQTLTNRIPQKRLMAVPSRGCKGLPPSLQSSCRPSTVLRRACLASPGGGQELQEADSLLTTPANAFLNGPTAPRVNKSAETRTTTLSSPAR